MIGENGVYSKIVRFQIEKKDTLSPPTWIWAASVICSLSDFFKCMLSLYIEKLLRKICPQWLVGKAYIPGNSGYIAKWNENSRTNCIQSI